MFLHASQWTHYDGNGVYRDDEGYVLDDRAPKQQASSRRWSYLPWTSEQEESCRLLVKLKVKRKRKVADDVVVKGGSGNEGAGRKKVRRVHRLLA